MHPAPTSVKVLSIIGIILSVLGLCGFVWSIIILFGDFMPNPMLEPLKHDGIYLGVTGVLGTIGIGFTFLLLAASIASLKLSPWARRGMIIYGWFGVIQCILSSIFNFLYVFPKMYAAAPPAMAGGAGVGMASGGIGMVLGLVFPICVIYFFARPHVIDAFNGIFPAAPTDFPVIFNDIQPPPPQQ